MKGDFSIFVRKLKGFGESEEQMIEIFGTTKKNYLKWKNAKWKVYPEMGNLEWNVLEHVWRMKKNFRN